MAAAWISASLLLCLLLFDFAFSADQINITAVIGENKTLPCRAENRPIRFVEWKRTDIKRENVLRYRNDAVDTGNQHPSFKDRVVFQDIEMKNGDVSLVLINVTMNDAGTYEAEVAYKETDREGKLICSIHLDVAPPPPPPPSSSPPPPSGQNNITAVIGENKTLPCRAENRPIRLVEWRRTDIKEDNVLRYRGQVDRGNQHPSFKDRVIFQDREMKDGNVSLVLINVTMNDAGTYEAKVAYKGTNSTGQLTCTIHLDVTPPPPSSSPPPPSESFPSWATALLVIAAVLVILGLILIGILLYSHHRLHSKFEVKEEKDKKRMEELFSQVPQVEEGKEFVLLPCRTRENLPGDARVEWKDGENDTVHVYKNGSDQPEEQDELYSKRTKMNEHLLRTGDLSLTLSFPTDEDCNIFTCSVYSKEEKILMKKQVQLKVKEHQVVVREGADSVTLPFRTTPNLPGETVVKWWDKKDNMVCVYKAGKDQEEEPDYRGRAKMEDDLLNTGDLSLILIKPTKKDSGRYYCGVYHQEIRRKAIVHLKVKAVDEVDQPQNQPEDSETRTTNQTPRGSIDPTPLLAEHAV